MCIFATEIERTNVVIQKQRYEIIIIIYDFRQGCNKVLTIESFEISAHHSSKAGDGTPQHVGRQSRNTNHRPTGNKSNRRHGARTATGLTPCLATEPQPPIAQKTLPVGLPTTYHSQVAEHAG